MNAADLDRHELAMMDQKWPRCWFTCTGIEDYYCGYLKNVEYSLPGRCVVSVILFNNTGSTERLLLLSNRANRRTTVLFAQEKEPAHSGVAEVNGSVVSIYYGGTVEKVQFDGECELDFTYPTERAVTLLRGPLEGTTVVLSRLVGDQNIRGLRLGTTVTVSYLDTREILMAMDEDVLYSYEEYARMADIYYSIFNMKRYSVTEAIARINEKNYISLVLKDELVVKLSLQCKNYLLMYDRTPIGEVDEAGNITFTKQTDALKDVVSDLLTAAA